MASSPGVRGPQAPADLAEAVYALALACGCTSPQARTAQQIYRQATRAKGRYAVLFRCWWQERTLAHLEPQTVLAPWATRVHQRIAGVLRERGLLGEEPLLLPCVGCGRLFRSLPPRFARRCGCEPYVPRPSPHRRGSRPMVSEGLYAAGPLRPQRGQSVLCAHPACTRFFLTNRPGREYCDEHLGDRKAATRARQRTPGAKRERVRFYPRADSGPVRCSFVVGDEERVCEISLSGYGARDDEEFGQLLQLAAAGLLAAHDASAPSRPDRHAHR